ncbi:MAG: formylmethanofuran dehydrogenase [Methylophilaceae bacterium]
MNQQSRKDLPNISTCPACGLLCDDVNPSTIGCAKSIAFFNQPTGRQNAQIKGADVSFEQAIQAASAILKHAKQPFFAGLSTDIEGFRAVNALAHKSNGSMQHMNHTSTQCNMRVLQTSGWQTTTLTEVKNHADLILCIGTDIVSHNPRFFERYVAPEGMFAGGKVNSREVIYIGTPHAPKGSSKLPCSEANLPEVLAVLQALLLNKSLKMTEVAGISLTELHNLADKLKAAKYSVLAWVSKDLGLAHAELTIGKITEIVATLNLSTRASGLPLGGSDGDTSVNYAHTWLNGVIINSEDVHDYDALVWVNSFNSDKLPPHSNVPSIAVGNPNMHFEQAPNVFIPIATPGLEANGSLFRVDGSVTLPLKKIRESKLPTLAEVLREIEGALA